MDRLSFFTPIYYSLKSENPNQNHLKKLNWVSKQLDNYFDIFGKKALIVKMEQKKIAHFYTSQSSLIIRIIKIASYFILPFSLPLLAAKFALREYLKQPIEVLIPEEEEKISQEKNRVSQQTIAEFQTAALEIFESKGKSTEKSNNPEINWDLSTEQKTKIAEVYYHLNDPDNLIGAQVVQTSNYILFLDNIPEFVFKHKRSPINEERLNKKSELENQMRQFVSENNLYLLLIPKSNLINVSNEYYIQQERQTLLASNFSAIQGLYTEFWNTPKLDSYMIELFTQLLKFIRKFNYKDVKEDNLPFTSQGQVALIDLDGDINAPSIDGLIRGCASKKRGLFSCIPIRYLDYFLALAKKELTSDLYNKLQSNVEAFIRPKALKRQENQENYKKFCLKNNIMTVSQRIPSSIIFKENDLQEFSEFILFMTNLNLKKCENHTLFYARKIEISINYNEIHEKAKTIWGNNIDFQTFREKIQLVLNKFKERNIIFKGKVGSNNFLSIKC